MGGGWWLQSVMRMLPPAFSKLSELSRCSPSQAATAMRVILRCARRSSVSRCLPRTGHEADRRQREYTFQTSVFRGAQTKITSPYSTIITLLVDFQNIFPWRAATVHMRLMAGMESMDPHRIILPFFVATVFST